MIQSQSKYSLVAWGQLCKPKRKGSLDILDLKTFNFAFLTKWWWCMLKNLEGQLQKLLQLKHGSKKDKWWGESHNTANTSTFWKWVLKIKDIFRFSISFNSDRKGRVSFWNDQWSTEVPLRVFFSNIFLLANYRNASAGRLWHCNRWDLGLSVHADVTAQLQVTKLKKLVQGHPTSANESNEVIWRWEKYGNFTVSSTYGHYIDGGCKLS